MDESKIKIEIRQRRLEASEKYSARISSITPDLKPHVLGELSPEEQEYCNRFLAKMEKSTSVKKEKPEGLDHGYPFKD